MNKHNIKIGDKVVCIKSVAFLRINFVKNKLYNVTGKHYHDYEIEFYLFSIKNIIYHNWFDDYFITLKELRKQKLDKLNSL